MVPLELVLGHPVEDQGVLALGQTGRTLGQVDLTFPRVGQTFPRVDLA